MKTNLLNLCVLPTAAALALGISSASAADGTWAVDASGSWNTASNWSPAAVPGGAGSTVSITQDITAARSVTIDTTSATVGTLNIGDSGGTAFAYTLNSSGGANLIMDNSGSQAQILMSGSANNTINAPIEMTADGLRIRNGSTGNLTVNSPITTSSAGTLEMSSATSAGSTTFGGAISGSTAVLVNAEAGNAMTISGSNSYTQGTTVRRGAFVAIGHDNAFGTGDVTLGGAGSTGTVLLYSGQAGRTIANNLVVSNSTSNTLQLGARLGSASLTWTGNIDLQRNLELNDSSTTGKVILTTGTISGVGKLILTGNTKNVTRLSGVGTFSGGVTASIGNTTLELGSATALGSGTLTVTGSNFSLDTAGSDLTLSTNNTIALSPTGTKALTYVGTGGSSLNVGTGTLSFSGNKSFTVQSGTLTIGGPVVNGGTLTKEGAGTLAFGGANTYTGDTNVSAGTLLINNSSGSGTGTGYVTVSSGATLGGGGSIGGDAEIQAGGSLKPGNSPGSLEFGGNLTLTGTAAFEITGTNFTLNGTEEYDRIKLTLNTAALDLTGSSLSVLDAGHTFAVGDKFGIIQLGTSASVTGLLGGFAEGATVGIFDGLNLKITYTANFGDSGAIALTGGNDIALYAVPEPGTWLLAAAGLALTLFRRRKE